MVLPGEVEGRRDDGRARLGTDGPASGRRKGEDEPVKGRLVPPEVQRVCYWLERASRVLMSYWLEA